MPEVALPGGRTDGAVLVDNVVRKRAHPSTPAVHALLRYLEEAGFEGAPRALGIDDQGRQMLSYLPGEAMGEQTSWPAWARTDSMLVQVGQWLRRLHDLTASFTPPADERWFIGTKMRPGLIIGHQDAAPHNAVVAGDKLVGFFDWDTAGPSPREFDLAFSALLWVPLTAPVREEEIADRCRRLHVLLDAYGYDEDRHGLGPVVRERALRQAGVIRQMAEAGDPASIALIPIATILERSAAALATLPTDFWAPPRVSTRTQVP
ncbi:phosphotransferase [Phytohabitans aurantiacus]|uniref:phosphotransferase n=1 Tax=Phytohabitans aurantiacus TaxID=3016789 RepID=UPI002492CEBF|nr:phosphotransferase [Phytohabitans aurantiacus]